MSYDASYTIAQFLDGTAAKQPAPGGGSVSALAGALSAAIGEMVLNYSIGKKGLEAHQDALKDAVLEMHRARQMLVELVVEDQVAYQSLNAVKKLPRESPEYQSQYPAALTASIRTPQAIVAMGVAILSRCDRLVEQVNFWLLSDLAVSAELAMATVRCGIHNVHVNQAELTDEAERSRVEESVGTMLSHAKAFIQSVIPRIERRMAEET